MGLFDNWPYTNFHELNLSWLLKEMLELNKKVDDFINLNAIKYADPIQWNIATQYEANTVVIDGNTGIAYISTKPVPSGVSLSNTDYWTVIFTLDVLSANQNITFRNDGANTLATFTSNTNDWLLWNSNLYKVSRPINVNEAYVVGYNIDRYTIELFVRDYVTILNTIIGDLSDLNTSDKSSAVNAINEVFDNVGDLSDLNTSDKSSAVNAINEVFDNVEDMYYGNYVKASSFAGADDTAILQNAIDNADFVILDRDFNITSVVISKPTHINLGGFKVTSNTTENNTFNVRSSDVTIFNGEIYTTESNVNNINSFGSCVYVNDWQLSPPIAQHINLHDLKVSTNGTAAIVYYGEMCFSEVYNIEFDGSRADVPYPEGINFEWTGTRHVITYHPHDIIVRNCYAHDYDATGGYPFRTSAAFNMIFENLFIYKCRDGISFEPGDYAGEAALIKYRNLVNKNLTARNIVMSDVRIGLSVIGIAGYQNGDITCHCSDIRFINPRSNSECIETNNAVNCLFENVTSEGGQYGVLSRGINETYFNCRFENIGDVGMYLLGENVRVTKTLVKNVNLNGNSGVTGSAVYVSGAKSDISSNIIGGAPSEAMTFSIRNGGNNSLITNNILNGINVSDVSTGSIVDNNIFIA